MVFGSNSHLHSTPFRNLSGYHSLPSSNSLLVNDDEDDNDEYSYLDDADIAIPPINEVDTEQRLATWDTYQAGGSGNFAANTMAPYNFTSSMPNPFSHGGPSNNAGYLNNNPVPGFYGGRTYAQARRFNLVYNMAPRRERGKRIVFNWVFANLTGAASAELFPVELRNHIRDYVLAHADKGPIRKYNPYISPKVLAAIPPRDGSCPLMKLPVELRKNIFAMALGHTMETKKYFTEPRCSDKPQTPSRPALARNQEVVHYDSGADTPNASANRFTGTYIAASKVRQKNKIANLMVLNKRICNEIALVLYEENFFTVHVHEGMKNGGIEFLNIGRQKLQYMSDTSDKRFVKFSQDEDFGFCRLKKVTITIYPAAAGDDFRHNSIFTYFTNLAVCRLLSEGRFANGRRDNITHIKINFGVDTNQSPKSNRDYWWDEVRKAPRTTSFEGLRNVEMALRAFANLSGCHNVDIELPFGVKDHAETVGFAERLAASMKSKDGISHIFIDDELDRKMQMARMELEDEVLHIMYGSSGPRVDVKDFTATEMHAHFCGSDADENDGDDGDDDDDEVSVDGSVYYSGEASPGPGTPDNHPFKRRRVMCETGKETELRELNEALLASLHQGESMDCL